MVVEVDKDEGAGEEDLKRVRVAIAGLFSISRFPPYPELSFLPFPHSIFLVI